MTLRSPEQIIGKDRLLQLIFEGYVVAPAEPTADMRLAGAAVMNRHKILKSRFKAGSPDIYKAMIGVFEQNAKGTDG